MIAEHLYSLVKLTGVMSVREFASMKPEMKFLYWRCMKTR